MGLRTALLVTALVGVSVTARAEDHKWAAFAAVSGTSTGQKTLGAGSAWNQSLAVGALADGERSGGGWHVATEVTLSLPWIFDDNIAFVGEASTHLIGEDKKSDAAQVVVMVGPRLGIALPGPLHLFGHFMGFGAIHRNDNRLDIDESAMAIALGGGLDFTPFNEGHDGFRIQVDRIFALGDQIDGSVRYSFGYVHRFD